MGFGSWKDFDIFEAEVKYKNRFVPSRVVSEFLSNLKTTLGDRRKSLSEGSILSRAQLGHDEYEVDGELIMSGYQPIRMKPIPYAGKEGRANPKGISYLYLSNDESTSIAELRPNVGQTVSSAQFKTRRTICLVDCYSVTKHYGRVECILDPPQTQEEISNAIWSMINTSFTRPVTNNDSVSDYVPTQFLAEFFKAEGFDGLCFKSGVGIGHNFILFDVDDADLINCTVNRVDSLVYQFSECTNRYYVRSDQYCDEQ